ncbi:phosphoprotein ECPP44-like [Punica granatum]|uniref:Uncharacterized protein n=2 Tax=Punica granatum TaxID=22663 RepID=A0A218X6A4_PUNGR|nr:phosphoprotein ECPP44-like [Punica granatum]OWM80464.1 hypothetical protein CDL15_Pgr019744 [Punica granatum]PKI63749.1 hypothetical protein CRG98_015870 [Punica granatum]
MADQQAQCHGCESSCKFPAEATHKEEVHGEKKDEENPTLEEQLHRSLNNSSLSSDEEGGTERKEKKKSKKAAAGEACDGEGKVSTGHNGIDDTEEKKGFLEKIKEKLPRYEKKPEGDNSPEPEPEPECPAGKKGILEKIKEKLPGCHKSAEDEKVKDN